MRLRLAVLSGYGWAARPLPAKESFMAEDDANASGLTRDFDILEMPPSGVAAYFLSVKKLSDTRKGAKVIQDEAKLCSEPYVRHVLETCFAFTEPMARRLARIKGRTVLREYARKHDLMRLAILAIGATENPRRTLVKMNSLASAPLVKEKKTFEMAQALIEEVKAGKIDITAFANVDHTLKTEQLALKLMYYVLLSRREGAIACQPYLAHIRSRHFVEGMLMLIDGFENPFIDRRLGDRKRAILAETFAKMDMALEMCLAVAAKLSYEAVFAVAKAYLPE
jgi:hypothetical protein